MSLRVTSGLSAENRQDIALLDGVALADPDLGHAARAGRLDGNLRLHRLEDDELVPDRDGRETWRQWMGRNSFVLERTRLEPARTVEFTIADDAKFFSGSWLYTIEPEAPGGGGGCRVTITENGRVHVAIPRFMMHYLMDPTSTVRKHLQALARKLGEEGQIVAAKA